MSSFVLAVHPSVPVSSIKELIALARSHPGQLKYASSGVGAPPHLAGELLKRMAKVDILHVPYKGVGQSISDLVAGHIDMMFTSPPNAIPQVKAGKLKALAVSTSGRSPLLPFPRLRALGFAIILLPVDTLLVGARAVADFLGELRRRDDVTSLADRYLPFREFNALIGVSEQIAMADRYREDA